MKENWAAIQLPSAHRSPTLPHLALSRSASHPAAAAAARPQPSTTAPHLRRRLSLHSRPSHPPPQVPPPPRHTSAAARPLLAAPHLFCRAPRSCTLCPRQGAKHHLPRQSPASRCTSSPRRRINFDSLPPHLPGAESASFHQGVSVFANSDKSCALL